MNPLIETLNRFGENALHFAWPMLWQSSVLIVVLFVADFALRRHVRAAVRHALWLVVVVKLLLPPSLALPTSLAWWLLPSAKAPAKPQTTRFVVSYGTAAMPDLPMPSPSPAPPLKRPLSVAAWTFLGWNAVSLGLLVWLMARWRRITREVQRATPAPAWLNGLFDEAKGSSGVRRPVCLRVTNHAMSPAVCGLFLPVILLPQSLLEKLPPIQLRAVLLHELAHLRRGDVWVNCAQALVQIFYWWHPLLWPANARIRRGREEAVDDAVMLALRDDAEVYAPTLLEVAKLAFQRPLASLGLVGILESRSALRQRIERLVNFRAPRKAGLTLVSLCSISIFSVAALPMGEAPPVKTDSHTAGTETMTFKIDRPLDADSLKKLLLDAGVKIPPTVYFYTDNGLLLVRGDKEQMALVYSAVLKLDGFSPKEIPGETKVDTNMPSGDLVREAKLDYEMGKLDEAEKLLASVLAREPQNQGAHYYMNLVQAAKTNQPTGMIRTSTGREKIVRKLNRIQFDRFGPYAGLPLSEIVRALNQQTAEFDSDKTGIHFFMAGNSDGRQPTIDANTGLPSKNTDPTGADINSVIINIDLTNVRLTDVLDGILLSANKPIQYSVLDNGIVFSSRRDPEIPPLETRTFRVDPIVFVRSLENATAGSTGPTNISQAAKQLFANLGLNLDPPKNVFFNDRLGVLFVRATEQDLDTVEKAVQVLNYTPPPQIHIKARFIEVPEEMLPGFGILTTITNRLNPATWTGIMPVESTRVLLQRLESTPSTEILAEPEVTTTSGRQTQMRATDILTIVTNFTYRETSTNSAMVPQTDKVECGPVFDVVPTLLADGYTIDLRVIASVTEFLGYDKPTNSIPAVPRPGTSVPTVLPRFQVRKTEAHIKLWDGQTAILGGVTSTSIEQHKELTTASGSISTDDTKVTGQTTRTVAKKQLLVLVTATLVDAAGKRIHSDNEMLIAPNGIPPQDSR